MQRQLLAIADKLPDDITLTLLKSFAQILSKEPEPAPRTPFIRAFSKKLRDDGTDKQFSVIAEEDEEQLKHYEGENECSFNYKVILDSKLVAVGETDSENEVERPAIADECDLSNESSMENETQGFELGENSENMDEGIELEMPPLLPSDDSEEAFEALALEEDAQQVTKVVEEVIKEPMVYPEPIPTEAPKVSLDDIERELQDMQNFLSFKGIKPEKKQEEILEVVQPKVEECINDDSWNIEDAYKLDVCINLKNHDDSERRHHHSKYIQSESYKEQIIDAEPIFDPNVPNTEEDFMKVKSISGRMDKKKQKFEALDTKWQNLCDNSKRLYR